MVQLSIAGTSSFFPDLSYEGTVAELAAAGVDAIEGFAGLDPAEAADIADDYGIDIAVSHVEGETSTIDGVSPAVGDPESFDRSVEDLERAIERAAEGNAHNVLVLVGQGQDDLDPHVQHVTIVDVLREVAPLAEEMDVTVVPEVLNTRVDHPGYYLASSYEGYEIVHAVDSPNVKILYDIYHQQITEGNVIENLTRNIEYVGHIHFADVPGRNEPGTGEVNYENVFAALEEAGYDGFVGAEHGVTENPDAVLSELVELAHS